MLGTKLTLELRILSKSLASSFWQLSGSIATNEFDEISALESISRVHQLFMEGEKCHFTNKNLVTT